jgi:hypothetical protein
MRRTGFVYSNDMDYRSLPVEIEFAECDWDNRVNEPLRLVEALERIERSLEPWGYMLRGGQAYDPRSRWLPVFRFSNETDAVLAKMLLE